ncbi:MAG TPA: response regulator [Gemmataceae bacterium]|jgi:CheY-like chemotaxis protein
MNRRLKIVVADDDRDTREYLQAFLTYLGYDVRSAEDGHRLVESCCIFRPDLIVTDFEMPGLDGLAAAAEVNGERPVPVILLSGRYDAEAAALAASHVVRFLMKPVKDADLRSAVEAAAARRAAAGG